MRHALAARGLADEFLLWQPNPTKLGWEGDLPHPTRWREDDATLAELVEQGRLVRDWLGTSGA